MKMSYPILGLALIAIFIYVAGRMHYSTVHEGEQIAVERCSTCHDLSAQQTKKQGPPLWSIVNRRAGSLGDFEYSDAFRRFTGSRQFSWSEANLDLLIAAPDQLIPGTAMAQTEGDSEHAKSFEGIQEIDKRGQLIAFLRTLN